MSSSPFWRSKSLEQMSDDEWESLCDGCGKCCLNKLEDEETGDIYSTAVACHLLNPETGRCSDYENRLQRVPDCLDLRKTPPRDYHWLPGTCAYRLLSEGQDLPEWHPLVSGDSEQVHRATCTTRHRVICETGIDPDDLEDHIIAWADR